MTEAVQYHLSGSTAREIAAGLEAAVRDGELSPGEPLPPIRSLAAQSGVSPATVASAVAELRRRGMVVTEGRRGTRISTRPPLLLRSSPPVVPPGARDLAHGNPDPELLPDLNAALARLDVPPRLYREDASLPDLLALAATGFSAAGIPAEHLCVVSGALDGVERALSAHLAPGDTIAIEDPCYAGLLDLVRALGLVPVPVPIDDAGLLPGKVAAALRRVRAVVVTPRGHNPTGAALDSTRAQALRTALASRPDVLVIEDDHLGPVAGAPAETTVPGRKRWAVLRSVAKSLGPDLRVAVLAGDAQTVARVQGRQLAGPGWVSTILQHLVVELWSSRDVGRLLRKAERTYSERRDALIDCLARHGVVARGRSGFNVWIPVPEEGAIVAALLREGWAVAPGEPYRISSPPAIRVTTTTLLPREGERFARCLSRSLRPSAITRSA